MTTPNPPLHGIRILDLSRLLPGPFCTMYLARLGAEVIKIEEPGGGDYARSLSPELFAIVNRNKRSVCLDLRRPQDAERLREMVRDADAVLESFRPGVMDRLGCGYQALRRINPALVYGALTGYGQDGPYRDRAGHDIDYRAHAGELDQAGAADGPPAPGNFQVADLAGGALTMALGLTAALLRAKLHGTGAFVDVAMLDGTFALQAVAQASVNATGTAPARGADMLSGGLPNYGCYRCADGRYLAVGALEPKFWQRLCAALDRPDLLRRPLGGGAAAQALRAELAALFATRPRDEWLRMLEAADCCVAPVLDPVEARQDPQLRARGMVEQVDGRSMPGFPIRLVDEELPPATPAPALGQDRLP